MGHCVSRCVSALDCYWVGHRVNDNYCELWGKGSCVTPHAQQNHDIYQVRESAVRPGPVVYMRSANMVCPSGDNLQTKEECQAFNGPGAGTWQGDLSGSAGHLAAHPRGCWVWNNANRHWIQPDGVIKREALSKPICYGTPARPGPVVTSSTSPVVMSSSNMVCASGTALLTMEECQAFNGPGAGTWQGDLSGSAGHVAVHPRGCWVWNGVNRHWIQPDGVIKTEALSKAICYGTSVSPIGRRLLSKQDN